MTRLIAHAPSAPLTLAAAGDGARAGHLAFDPVGTANVGLWEVSPGTLVNNDDDEIFVVLSGAARVFFPADEETLEIGPGSVVRLVAGETSIWNVTETLRKVYVYV
jgi:uncharacterized protein